MKRIVAAAVVLVMILGTALAGCDRDQKADEEIISLVWPIEMVTEDPDNFSESLFLQQNEGFTKATLNDDGTISVSMEESTYNYIKDQFSEQFDLFMEELVGGEQTEYINEINYDPEFRNIEIIVDKESFEADEEIGDQLLVIIASNIGTYHQITGQEKTNTLKLIDFETDEVIQTFNYPDDLEE